MSSCSFEVDYYSHYYSILLHTPLPSHIGSFSTPVLRISRHGTLHHAHCSPDPLDFYTPSRPQVLPPHPRYLLLPVFSPSSCLLPTRPPGSLYCLTMSHPLKSQWESVDDWSVDKEIWEPMSLSCNGWYLSQGRVGLDDDGTEGPDLPFPR